MDTKQDQLSDSAPYKSVKIDGESSHSGIVNLAEPFSWIAPEGVHVAKGKAWYIAFGIVVTGFMALAVFAFKSWTFSILLPVMATAVVILSVKPPHDINYAVGPKGIHIGDRLYDYSEFRAFGVHKDSNPPSIIMLPVKRFSTGITLYFSEAEGERIVDMLGARLPLQEIKYDTLDKLIRLTRL